METPSFPLVLAGIKGWNKNLCIKPLLFAFWTWLSFPTGEWDGGEWSVWVRLRVSVQWAWVSGSGGPGPANARLLPYEEPQLCESHWEGLLPRWWVHITAVFFSPANNHYSEDHPEQYWWVTRWEMHRSYKNEGTFLCSSIRSAIRSLPDPNPWVCFSRELDRVISLKLGTDPDWCSCVVYCVQANLFCAQSTQKGSPRSYLLPLSSLEEQSQFSKAE